MRMENGCFLWKPRLEVHTCECESLEDGVNLGEAQVYAVTDRDPELDEVVPDSYFLEALAAANQGRYHGPDQYASPTVDEEAGRWVENREEHPLWAGAWLPLWVGFFGSSSWWIRRRNGGR